LLRGSLGPGKDGKQNRGENCDDGNNHQKLDESKAAFHDVIVRRNAQLEQSSSAMTIKCGKMVRQSAKINVRARLFEH
jgi:hypothetical protein